MRFAESNKQSLAILAAAVLILGNTLLHAHVYGNRNYREDEVFVTRLSSLYSWSSLVLDAADDPGELGWRLLVDIWLDSFGLSEEITRWLSRLINLATFSLLYQLGKQICDRRVGLYAIVLLGIYGFAASAMYELRPYPFLIAQVTALHLCFYRWMRKPSSALMFAYTLTGVAAIYTHFFSVFVFPAHAVCLALFTRFERKLWLSSLVMWFAIGLSFLGWLLPFLQAILIVMPGGIYYAIPPGWAGILLFYNQSRFQPELIFQFLMLLSLRAPLIARNFTAASSSRLRFNERTGLLYAPALLLSTLLIAYGANFVVSNFSLRNVVMFAPLIAVCMALGLRLLPTKAALILLSLLMLHAPVNLRVQVENAPYREFVQTMAPTYQDDSVVVTEFSWAWRWLLPSAYYLMDFTPDKMSKQRQFHLIEARDSAHPPNYPDELVNIFKTFEPAAFESQLPPHNQLWRLTEGGGNDFGAEFSAWLNQNYTLVQTRAWAEPYVTNYALSEYAKAPEHEGPLLVADDALQLYVWSLGGSVEFAPCETVQIESWWQLNAEVDLSYSLSIILAAEDGDGQLAIQNSIPAQVFTTEWQANRFYRDQTTLQIPCDIDNGRYNLLLAAKETLRGAALPLRYPDGGAIGNEYYLTTLQISSS